MRPVKSSVILPNLDFQLGLNRTHMIAVDFVVTFWLESDLLYLVSPSGMGLAKKTNCNEAKSHAKK